MINGNLNGVRTVVDKFKAEITAAKSAKDAAGSAPGATSKPGAKSFHT